MKISNSRKRLAKIISENGGWKGGNFCAQQDDGEIWFSNGRPGWNKGRGTFTMNYENHITIGHLISNRHQTIVSRDEYFHLYPVPDTDGWIKWKGGECPCPGASGVARLRDGKEIDFSPQDIRSWGHLDMYCDIIAYRLHKPEQSKSTAVGDDETNLAAKEELEALEFRESPEKRAKLAKIYAPSIEQLSADYRVKLAIAQQAQEEADAANREADAALCQLERAGEAIGLLISPIKDDRNLAEDWGR